MAFFDDEGEIHFTPAELHALETEFFQFEEKIAHIDPESLRTELLASKWNELIMRERLALIERKPEKKNWFG